MDAAVKPDLRAIEESSDSLQPALNELLEGSCQQLKERQGQQIVTASGAAHNR